MQHYFDDFLKIKISRHYPLTDCDLRAASAVLSNVVTSLFDIHQTSPLALHLSQQSASVVGHIPTSGEQNAFTVWILSMGKCDKTTAFQNNFKGRLKHTVITSYGQWL